MRRHTAAAVLVSTVLGLAACAEMPAPTPPPAMEIESSAVGVNLFDRIAARGPHPLRRLGGSPVTGLTVVTDPGDPNTETHTFDDLPVNCFYDAVLPDPYEGLDFLTTPYFAGCLTPNGTMGIVPANRAASFANQAYEVRILLPFSASAASMEVYDLRNQPIQLNGYDANGALVASTSVIPPLETWGTITLSSASANFKQLGITMYQAGTYVDNLKITYKKDPTDKDQCKDGGWAAFGFRNQGQCVRFVETGKDSRAS